MELEQTKPVWVGHLLTEINKKISAGVPYQKVLDFALDSVALLIPYDRIGIALLEGPEGEEKLRLTYLKSKIPATNLNVNYTASLNASSLRTILETGRPRIINDLIDYYAQHPHSDSTKRAIQDGIRSSLTCCLSNGKKCVGFLFFSSTKPNTYRDIHVDTFLAIAEELSMIIDYGRLKQNSTAYTTQSQNLRTILHDLRAPLSVIEGFVRASVEEPWYAKIDDDAKQIFSILLRNTQSMFDLLNELMEISRLDQAHEKLQFETVNLRDFFNEMENFGRILAEHKHIRFSGRIDESCPETAILEKQYVRRALQNLFTNAVKFSRRDTKIGFEVFCNEGKLFFSVQDEGPGIPQKEIPNLFKDFGKTSIRPTENESSTGLGLAIVKRLIELHGGDVGVTSEPGKGSKFSFWIPLKAMGSYASH